MGKKVIVTGGGGFLGKAIARRLLEKGDEVISLCRQRYSELEQLGVQQITGDIRDSDSVNRAFAGADIVFHTAAKAGVWGDYQEYYDINVIGTRNVIAGVLKNNVSRLIHTSSPSVVFNGKDMDGVDERQPYPDDYSAYYPKTKAIAEQEVKRAASEGLKTIILRPHLIWGPEDNHLTPRILARASRLVQIGSGENLVDTVYITNAAQAHILAADKLQTCPELSGRVYFISQGEPIKLWDMINRILQAGGYPPVKRSISPAIARIIGIVLENIYRAFRIQSEPRMTKFLAEELATAHWFDISAAKQDLGYLPEVSTETGLELLEAWLKENRQGAWKT